MLYHSIKDTPNLTWIPAWLTPVSQLGFLGVDVFFVLSGIVIAKSMRGKTAGQFWKARFGRLYPTFVLSTAIVAVVLPTVVKITQRDVLLNLWAFSGLSFWLALHYYLISSWTLQYEVEFYLLIGALIIWQFAQKQMGITKSNWPLILAYLVSAVSLWNGVKAVYYGAPGANGLMVALTLSSFAPYFVLGMLISKLGETRNLMRYLPPMLLAYLSVLWSVQLRTSSTSPGHQLNGMIGFSIMLALMIASQFVPQNWNPRFSAALTTASLMTYPTYLLHEMFGLSIVMQLVRHHIWSVPVDYLVAFLAVLLVSYLMVKFYEPAARRLINLIPVKN